MDIDIEKIKEYWDTKLGLFIVVTVFLSLYFTAVKDIVKELLPNFGNYILNLIIPGIFVILIYIFWAIKTHRLCLTKNKKITIGIFLRTDDPTTIKKIKQVVKNSIEEIEEKFDDINLKLFSINFIKTTAQLEKYLASNSHSLDCAIFAKVIDGNQAKDDATLQKTVITNIIFSGAFNVNEDRNIFRSSINLSKDLFLRNIGKNWEYIENNSLVDKEKLKSNLKDTILFYAGVYLIYMNELDTALKVFKTLKNLETVTKSNPGVLGNSRLNQILLELFFYNASQYYVKRNPKKAFDLLIECGQYFQDKHPLYFGHNIALARLSYELGNIPEAYKYAAVAKSHNPHSSLVCINNAFFALIENNVKDTYKYYKELAHTYKHKNENNFIDTIEFLEVEKGNYPESKILFDFAIASLNFLYADRELGRQMLTNLQTNIQAVSDYKEIYELIIRLLTKGSYRSAYHNRSRKSKKKKKR